MKHAGTAETCIGVLILFVLAGIAGGMYFVQSLYDPAFFNSILLKGTTSVHPLPAGKESAPVPAFLPENLTPLGPEEQFDSETLSDKIDGKAELYLSSGFRQLTTRRFARKADPKSWLELFVYDMGDANNAFSVYSMQKRKDARKADVAVFAYRTDDALFFISGSRYFEIISGATDMGDEMLGLARNLVEAEPKSAAQAMEFSLFPQESLDPASISLHMSDVFGFSDLDRVYTAQYQAGNDQVLAFISRRESPDEASALAAAYGRFLVENGGKELGEIPGVPDSRLFQVYDTYEAVFHRGRFLAGTHEVENREAAAQIAAQVYRKINEDAE